MRRFLAFLAQRTETRALLLWLAATGALAGFVNIAGEVSEGETEAIDRSVMLALRSPGDISDPIGPPPIEEAMRDLTALGGWTLLTVITSTAVLAFAFNGKRRQAVILLCTVLLAQLSSELLKTFYDRPRPALVPHGVEVYSRSFPSGHSIMSAATFLTIATLVASLEPRRATKVIVYVLACFIIVSVGVSRVYLGVHWPSDVVGGWCLGSAWAFVAWITLKWPSKGGSVPRD